MKIMLRFNIVFFALILLQCCTKVDESPDLPKAIVEGYLIAGNPVSVRITKELTYGVVSTDGSSLAITDLDVSLTSNNVIYKLNYTTDGYYTTSEVIVQPGQSYSIAFNYLGKSITSSTTVPALPVNYTATLTTLGIVPAANPSFSNTASQAVIQYNWLNTTNEYYMVVVENTEANPAYIYYNEANRPRPTFRVQPSVVDNYTLRQQSIRYFGNYNVILFRLNAEYATLYNDNSNSSQNLTTPLTNVNNGLGIFTGISSDTIPLYIQKE